MPTRAGDGAVVRGLTGVYDARGTLAGEVAYVVGKLLGRRHCALCDITHGPVREKGEWRACRSGLPVPFVTVHLDEQAPDVATFTEGRTPAVVAETDGGLAYLLGPDELEACAGEPQALVEAVGRAVAAAGLTWP